MPNNIRVLLIHITSKNGKKNQKRCQLCQRNNELRRYIYVGTKMSLQFINQKET